MHRRLAQLINHLFPLILSTEIEIHQQMEVTSTSDQEQTVTAAIPIEEPVPEIETSLPTSQQTTEATAAAADVVTSPKDEGNCYSFTVPPPRPFHQVLYVRCSVQHFVVGYLCTARLYKSVSSDGFLFAKSNSIRGFVRPSARPSVGQAFLEKCEFQ